MHWSQTAPPLYSIVTGFFPEARPKHNWETNPRPLLVTGVFRNRDDGMYALRIAYGTSRPQAARGRSLSIGNVSWLNQLNLAKPTTFILEPGSQMAIMPWTDEHFKA